MEIYFYSKPYERKELVKKLEAIGFRESENELIGCEFPDESLWINFTDIKESRFQIQGYKLDEIYKMREKSKYYNRLKELAGVIKPHTIIDCCFRDIFPELVSK